MTDTLLELIAKQSQSGTEMNLQGGADTGIEIVAGRGCDARRKGCRREFMIGDEHQEPIERARHRETRPQAKRSGHGPRQCVAAPDAKLGMTSNPASLNPPTFSLLVALGACVVAFGVRSMQMSLVFGDRLRSLQNSCMSVVPLLE